MTMAAIRLFNFKSISYEFFMALFLSWFAVSGAVLGITKNLLHVGKLDTLLLYGSMLLLFGKVFGVFCKRLKSWQIASAIGILTIFLIAMFFSSIPDANQEVIMEVVIFCLPCYVLAGCVRDYSSLYKYLLVIMQIIPYVHVLSFLFLNSGQLGEDEDYSQSMSYRYLFPAIILLSDILSRFSFKSLVPFLICLFLIIAYGARGPWACLSLFTISYWIVMPKSIRLKKLLIPLLILSVIVAFVIIRFNQVIDYMTNLMTSLNSSVRILQKMMDESLMEDEIRDDIVTACLSRVFENPFWGTGPINDRVFLWYAFHSTDGVTGTYPHNFFVEVLTQYGLFLGLVLIGSFLVIIYQCLRHPINLETQKLFLVFIGAYFFPLLFSGSYVDSKGFYILLATCIVIRSMGKVKQSQHVTTL